MTSSLPDVDLKENILRIYERERGGRGERGGEGGRGGRGGRGGKGSRSKKTKARASGVKPRQLKIVFLLSRL